jgi:predicted  nucleic acid-binding Zn-ribbon protein
MVKHKNLLAAVAVIVCCITLIWFSTTTQGRAKTYEIQPRVSVPEYKTDAARAIDAYERLMERFINVTDRSSIRIERDLTEVIKKLDSINNKLTRLSLRIERIEKTFGIEESKLPESKKPRPKAPENKAPNESFPIW